MKDYIQVTLDVRSDEQKEILIAVLADAGYEGFEEDRQTLKAFIIRDLFDETALKDVTEPSGLTYRCEAISPKNWNASWEASFEPVVVHDFCAIRADFHAPVTTVRHEIVITPKMSFGTGHHATTFMMIQAMEKLDMRGKEIFDFGTGTGVLAILAEKCGAKNIDAVDNDDWSIENAAENIQRNACHNIQLHKADTIISGRKYDVILANINRNIILQHLHLMCLHLKANGVVLLSGLLNADEGEVVQKANEAKLIVINKFEKHNWICLQCVTEGISYSSC
jgi:ribosomal protein L11 methyltransferase